MLWWHDYGAYCPTLLCGFMNGGTQYGCELVRESIVIASRCQVSPGNANILGEFKSFTSDYKFHWGMQMFLKECIFLQISLWNANILWLNVNFSGNAQVLRTNVHFSRECKSFAN